MGVLHADLPAVPFIIGTLAVLAAGFYAFDRPTTDGGIIILFGLLLWLFWTGFLRVGSQISLFLAPLAAVLLLVAWLGGFSNLNAFDDRRAQLDQRDAPIRTFIP